MGARVHSTMPEPKVRSIAWPIQNAVERLIALAMFIVLLPVIVLLWVLVKAVDRQSPFFFQERVGEEGRTIRLLKFRTMREEADPYALKPPDDDPRITRMGRLLRPRAIDELPQLWNVIKGDMALVGPRPEMRFIVDSYGPVEKQRLVTKPGLTGLWQLSRVRDRAIHHHMEYDLFYVYNRSAGMDLWLLWRTLLFALFGKSTKIRLAVQRWERDGSWRRLVPDRSMAIPPRDGLRLAAFWIATVVAVLLVLLGPALAMTYLARSDLFASRELMLDARMHMRELRPESASRSLDDASENLRRADRRLSSFWIAPAKLLPGVPSNLNATRAFVSSGEHLVAAGRAGLQVFAALPKHDGKFVPPINGSTVDVAALSRATGPARVMRAEVARAAVVLESVSGPLLPQVSDARDSALRTLVAARREADIAAAAATLVPKMLGAEGARTWIVGAENLAELRGRGGYLGAFGILTADNGSLSFGDFTSIDRLGRPSVPVDDPSVPQEVREHYYDLAALEAWQNFTMSPRFASGASLLVEHLPSAGFPKASGVISLDPVGLSYLLDVVGPVKVADIDTPLTKDNIVEWTLNKAYFQFARSNDQRREVLGEVADAVWSRILGSGQIDGRRLAEAFGRALSERHLVIYSADAAEQRVIERLGIDGGVATPQGDSLLVLSQNLGEGKMDYYIKREISHDVDVAADGSARASLKLKITNTAPTDGSLPAYIGGARPTVDLAEGWARSYLSALVPADAVLDEVKLDGTVTANVDNRPELDRRLFGLIVKTAPGATTVVEMSYRLPDAIVDESYRLTVQRQATVTPDLLQVSVDLPAGAGIGRRAGFRAVDADTVAFSGELTKDRTMSVQVTRSGFDRWRDTLRELFRT